MPPSPHVEGESQEKESSPGQSSSSLGLYDPNNRNMTGHERAQHYSSNPYALRVWPQEGPSSLESQNNGQPTMQLRYPIGPYSSSSYLQSQDTSSTGSLNTSPDYVLAAARYRQAQLLPTSSSPSPSTSWSAPSDYPSPTNPPLYAPHPIYPPSSFVSSSEGSSDHAQQLSSYESYSQTPQPISSRQPLYPPPLAPIPYYIPVNTYPRPPSGGYYSQEPSGRVMLQSIDNPPTLPGESAPNQLSLSSHRPYVGTSSGSSRLPPNSPKELTGAGPVQSLTSEPPASEAQNSALTPEHPAWRLSQATFEWIVATLDPKRRPDKSKPAPAGQCRLCPSVCKRSGTLQQHIAILHRQKLARRALAGQEYCVELALAFVVAQIRSNRNNDSAEVECAQFRHLLSGNPAGLPLLAPNTFPKLKARLLDFSREERWIGVKCPQCGTMATRKTALEEHIGVCVGARRRFVAQSSSPIDRVGGPSRTSSIGPQ